MTNRSDADGRFMILPIETRARELDAKLLFGLIAIESNFQVILSQKWLINVNLHKLPRGIFVFKTLNAIDANVMRMSKPHGYTIAAWDDEGPGQIRHDNYLKGLVDDGVELTERIFAWGENQLAALSGKYPQHKEKFVATGNPRWDLLRPEYRKYYSAEADALRARFGRFILINTNFAFFNSVLGDFGALMRIQDQAGFLSLNNKDDVAMGEAIWRHEKGTLKSFVALVPALRAAFPEHTIIIRPHPTENHQRWHDLAVEVPKVKAIHEGPVIPWLIAAEAVIQNGCTTGVETYTLGQPVIS